MSSRPHIIRRIQLELDLNLPRREAFVVQEEVKNKVKEIVDNVFSSIQVNEDYVRISRLVIDLGVISRKELGRKLAESMAKNLQNALSEAANATRSAEVSTDKETPPRTRHRVKQFELFLHFLKTGSFPWWAKGLDRKVWENEMEEQLRQEADTAHIANWVDTVIAILRGYPFALNRLILQFSEAVQLLLFQVITRSLPTSGTHDSLEALRQLLKNKSIKEVQTLWIQILEQSQNASFEAEPKQGSAAAISKNFDGSKAPSPNAGGTITESERGRQSQMIKKSGSRGNDTFPLPPPASHFPGGEKPQPAFPNAIGSIAESEGGNESQTIKKSSSRGNDSFPPAASRIPGGEEEAYYLENAGLALVLTSTFYLFQELGYLGEDRLFKNRDCQERAIHVLQYMATGEQIFPENELVLNKIVCGWPLEEPLRCSVGLSPQEIETADGFLQQLIDEWGVLKNTTPAGLRYNFLLRNGKLSEKSSHWLLQVEKTGYDALLMDRLPWSISLVKFNWMEKRLQVEWIN